MAQRTQVGIVGAGPAGLTLALLLEREGVESVVLDDRNRGYIERWVRAGLLEALEIGLLAAAGPIWRFAIMRPREHPMAELASALLEALGGDASMEASALRRAALDRGPLSLIEELRERPLSEHANLMILVDQFEELFRYRDLASHEEAEAFVAHEIDKWTQLMREARITSD